MPHDPELRERLLALAEPVAQDLGLNLVDVTLRRSGPSSLVTVTIDRPGGVTVEDCRRMSRALEERLDAGSWFAGPYRLDVESPGIDRVLRTPREFRYFAGREVEVVFKDPGGGRHRVTGTLRGLEGDDLVIDEAGQERRFALDQVARVRLHVRF
ncbi:MAG: ribosome maturation factor RimP [Thermaerobacter sp.]